MEISDAPPTPEEIAESHGIASAHLAIVRKALAGFPLPARRRNREAGRQTARLPGDDDRPERFLPTIAWLLVAVCKRGDCRRRRRCCHGDRRTDGPPLPERLRAPCFEALPKAVQLALPLAMMRRHHPEMFRDPAVARREAEAIRAAHAALAEAGPAGDPAAREPLPERWRPQPHQTATPAQPPEPPAVTRSQPRSLPSVRW
ncbi:hypothetical protein [Mangrovicella endophytica]|uniref:hypothetical protein n=1 Tax=Mangrovicella endophytica TaxID=2066697 RepID=UPI000C9DFFAC|nr:hypothetical protein [Mangrovicella endophytica]